MNYLFLNSGCRVKPTYYKGTDMHFYQLMGTEFEIKSGPLLYVNDYHLRLKSEWDGLDMFRNMFWMNENGYLHRKDGPAFVECDEDKPVIVESLKDGVRIYTPKRFRRGPEYKNGHYIYFRAYEIY